jgi:hypothetical protein
MSFPSSVVLDVSYFYDKMPTISYNNKTTTYYIVGFYILYIGVWSNMMAVVDGIIT